MRFRSKSPYSRLLAAMLCVAIAAMGLQGSKAAASGLHASLLADMTVSSHHGHDHDHDEIDTSSDPHKVHHAADHSHDTAAIAIRFAHHFHALPRRLQPLPMMKSESWSGPPDHQPPEDLA